MLSLFSPQRPRGPGDHRHDQRSQPVQLRAGGSDEDGDFQVRGKLTDASGATPPLDCGDNLDARPVLLVRNWNQASATTGAPAAPGPWFAAGVIAAKWSKGRWKYWD